MMRTSLLALASLLLVGCPRTAKAPDAPGHDDAAAKVVTNRIDAPDTVRKNLGIAFEKAQERAITHTRRFPGTFAFRPEARRRYATPIAGKVELAMGADGAPTLRPGRLVRADEALFTVVAPAWRELQRELARTASAVDLARAEAARTASDLASAPGRLGAIISGQEAAKSHVDELVAQTVALQRRIDRLEPLVAQTRTQLGELEQAKVEMAFIRSSVSDAREQHAELEQKRLELAGQLAAPGSTPSALALAATAQRAALEAALAIQAATLAQAAELHGLTSAQLLEPVEGGRPRWQALSGVVVRATAPGIVLSLAPVEGAWVEERAEVATTADPAGLVFEAHAPQADLAWLSPSLTAAVAMPEGMGVAPGAALAGALAIGAEADPHARTVPLFLVPSASAPWARAGVAAWLEVAAAGGGSTLAIPRAAVIRDGLTDVFFRRDPRNPDKLIRIEGDLGVSDGKWVEVKSGLALGDEVVVAGVYPLMLANSGQQRKGGHFHADGTWHEGSH